MKKIFKITKKQGLYSDKEFDAYLCSVYLFGFNIANYIVYYDTEKKINV